MLKVSFSCFWKVFHNMQSVFVLVQDMCHGVLKLDQTFNFFNSYKHITKENTCEMFFIIQNTVLVILVIVCVKLFIKLKMQHDACVLMYTQT